MTFSAADFRIGETTTIVFPPGSTNMTICAAFSTNDDILVEPAERFFVNSNNGVALLNAPVLVEIVDNDGN